MPESLTPQQQLDALDSEFQSLQDEATFSAYKASLADLDGRIAALTQKVKDTRQRGYRYKSYLEGKVEAISAKWKTAMPQMKAAIAAAERQVQPAHADIARVVSVLRGAGSIPMGEVAALSSRVTTLKGQIESANATINATYSAVSAALGQTEHQVGEVTWLLEQVETASFPMLANENAIQAVKAKWWRDGEKKGPEGILYLTDQRLVFEQKEEVATKKVLFIATEKQMTQAKAFESPSGSIESVLSSSKGLFGHEDHLDFKFGAGVEFPQAHFHIDGQESDWWVGLVNRLKSGDLQGERFYAPGESAAATQQAMAQALAAAPEKCSSCGAPFGAPLAKGQQQIQCEYCGTTMRW